jgi:putative transposase
MCASARFWASVTADLRNRGVRDILIACCDGLAGFEDAIHAAFPHTVVQTCVVHLIRNSLRPVARRDAAAVAAGLRTIYTAADPDAAFDALAAFSASPIGQKYPRPSRSGRAPGTGSRRSWPSPRRCASCSAPPTASSR